jgi:hypothetical protein
VFDLVQKHVEAGVEPLGDRVVERCLEPLLLPDDGVQEIPLVDIRRLLYRKGFFIRLASSSRMPHDINTSTHHFLVEEHLHHLLYRISKMDKLKEFRERGNIVVFMLARLPQTHMNRRSNDIPQKSA